MSAPEIILGILLIISAVLICIVVLMQESKATGLSGAIAGGSDSFLGKNQGRTKGAKFAKWTKILAIVFFVLIFAANVILLLL